MKSFLKFVCVALVGGFGSVVAQNTAPANAESTAFSGKVAETINASTYTYILVDTGTTKIWAAAPQFDVKIGDAVDVTNGMAMPKFHSDTLNRDFDVIFFTGSVAVNGKAVGVVPPTEPAPARSELPKDHPPIGGGEKMAPPIAPGTALPKGHPSIDGAGKTAPSIEPGTELPKDHPPIEKRAAAPIDFTDIKKLDDGKTVTEIVAGRAELAGKEVAVRGKVVKYNDGVLGKNWLHIRDGSGSPGTNDLTITTAATTKVGDTVVVKGKVAIDRDFGSGYKYSVIIEDGQVTVE